MVIFGAPLLLSPSFVVDAPVNECTRINSDQELYGERAGVLSRCTRRNASSERCLGEKPNGRKLSSCGYNIKMCCPLAWCSIPRCTLVCFNDKPADVASASVAVMQVRGECCPVAVRGQGIEPGPAAGAGGLRSPGGASVVRRGQGHRVQDAIPSTGGEIEKGCRHPRCLPLGTSIPRTDRLMGCCTS